LPVSHLVYGLRISVPEALPGIPFESEFSEIDVRIRLKQFPAPSPLPSGFFYISPQDGERGEPNLRVGALPGGKHIGFFYGDGARFAVDREGREVWADWPREYTLEDAATYLLGPIFAFVLRLRGFACLHASAVALDGRAIALFGFAGAGKSTTAAAFALSGFSVLSDDLAVLVDRGDRFLVQPGYPRLNLWPDSVRTLFGSEGTLPLIAPTWDKRYLALDQEGCRFEPKPLPLGAVYILDEREEGLTAPVVEELAGCSAFTALVANTYLNYLLDIDMRLREFDVLSRVLAGVPVRRVRPTSDPGKTFALCDTIAADAMRLMVRKSVNGLRKRIDSARRLPDWRRRESIGSGQAPQPPRMMNCLPDSADS
jgi:hypothetical protein